MDFFFNPKGIAVIGATTNPVKGGNSIVKNLLVGFPGPIYPINPRYESVEGLRCYPSVKDVPDPVDMAIVYVPGTQVPGAVADCAARGLKGAMIEASGFAEIGDQGQHLNESLIQIAKDTGIRLWGPNCMGLVDAVKHHYFTFMFSGLLKKGFFPGRVSMIVQSGMLSAGFLVDIMTNNIMGINKICSIGNKIDVNECDLLPWLIEDEDTSVIGLYLESIIEGRRFIDICRQSTKPIVLLKGGRTSKGAQAAISHTASLAGNHEIIRGAMAQAGIIEATDFRELMDLCRSLALAPAIPKDRPGRVAVLTFSGGAGIVFADFIEEMGLTVADLSDTTKAALEKIFPEWMPPSNPVDMFPAIEHHAGDDLNVSELTLQAVIADPAVDAILLHIFASSVRDRASFETIVRLVKETKKPVFLWLLGERDLAFKILTEARDCGIPIFTDISRAVQCMAEAFRRK
jgi:acetate---CoA ligase (ADP-forming)